ncbi:hypothetical protein [Methylomonas rosea]|uniref:Uncharacterized protein n=1 Tax=Methylomonas rosea TaxID=2952227 RepID=A0ABT1TYV0_9GAMM|nr:hypothetical protein [Methylomonas sp. WSC-7]MCQ8119934.1 hypothetical protein [Methylomonas sp. WSC-7]
MRNLEMSETEHNDLEANIQQLYDLTQGFTEQSSQFLSTLYSVKKSRFFTRWDEKTASEFSDNFNRSLYSVYPWVQCFVREHSSVVMTAINIGQKPDLCNFASLSALSSVPKNQQKRAFEKALKAIPDCDIKRANLIIRSVNKSMGLGDILTEYSTELCK